MSELEKISKKGDTTAHELHLFISSKSYLHEEVLEESKKISSRVDSLLSAIIILGVNTVKDIVLTHSEKPGLDSLMVTGPDSRASIPLPLPPPLQTTRKLFA